MCGFGLFSLSTLALIGLYAYVFVAIMRAEYKANRKVTGLSWLVAASWPLTIWNSIEKLYRS